MLDELKKGLILPEKYVIVGQRIKMKFHESGIKTIDELRNDDIFLMRCGSEQLRHGFLDKIAQKYESYGNRHRVNDVNYSINQGRLLFAGGSSYDYLVGGNLSDDGRFVGVPSCAAGAARKISDTKS